MKQPNKRKKVWGVERNIERPIKLFTNEDDLSSDGKIILCSKKQKSAKDLVYISKQWLEEQLQECLDNKPDILTIILHKIRQ